jgi:type IV pilus assembly protein PilP
MIRKTSATPPSQRRHAMALRLALAGLIALAASGCARDTSDLDAWIAEVKAKPSAPIEPIPEMKPFDSFSYSSVSLRDPFAPLAFVSPQTVTASASGPRPDSSRPRELLEEFPLDTLRMMGTLQQQGNLWALVKDPGGTIHRVQMGNYLGQNHGRVVAVDEQQVSVLELISDSTGNWIERQAALAIQE